MDEQLASVSDSGGAAPGVGAGAPGVRADVDSRVGAAVASDIAAGVAPRIAGVAPGGAGVAPGIAGVASGIAGVASGIADVASGIAGVDPDIAGVAPGVGAGASRIPRDVMKMLLAKRDGPGLALFCVQLTAFVLLSLATIELAAAGSWLRWPVVVADGLVLLMFFASMHEAGHGTAFATPWMNRVVTWISAALMLQSPTFFREFHFEHHRRTSDPSGDPEISGAPKVLGVWPANPIHYFLLASGQHLMFGKAMFTIGCAVAPAMLFEKYYPFMKPAVRPATVRESRLVVAMWMAALWYGGAFVPGFGTLLLAWPVAHLGLGLFVMPEHTGLASDGSQLRRTRSTKSNAIVRAAMWNMPYHAEHHEYPAVPFHAAPELSRRIDGDLENRASGYLAFHAEALRRSFGWG